MEKTLETKTKLGFVDFVILSTIALFFYIDFIPSFRAIEVRGVQYLYMAIINLLIGGLFFAYPKFINNEIITIFKKSFFVKIYFLFLILCCLSVFSAKNTSLWFISISQILIVTITIFNFCVLLFDKKYLFYHICFLVGIFTLLKSFNEITFLLQQKKVMNFAAAVALLKGNTGNINIFSASLNVKMPFLILGIMHFSNWKKWMLVVSIILSVFIIYILDSRATILALIMESIVIVVFLVWKSSDKKKLQINLLSTIVPIIIGITIGFLSFKQALKNENVIPNAAKVAVGISKVAGLELKDGGSVKQRLDYWSNASKIIKNKPFLGIGLGNWCVESIPYEKLQSNGMIISVHPHNDFLEIASETGILNGIVFFGMFVILLMINIKKIFRTNDELSKNIAFLCLLLLIAYGVDSFFNFPLHRPTVTLGFCFLVIFSLLNIEKNDDKTQDTKTFSWNLILLSIVAMINLFSVFFSFQNFMSLRLSNEIIVDLPNEKKTLTSDYIIEHYPSYPTVMFNSQPFAEYVGIYLTREKKYDLAQKYLNEANRINPYVGRVEWYKYSIAKEKNKLDSAYVYAKQAFAKKPRNYDFFNTVIYMANQFRDTTEILKTHNIYHNLVKAKQDYIETSSGLHNSSYSKKGLIKFIEIGLKEFPNDSLLLRRKRVFEYELQTNSINKGVVAPQVTNLANENTFEKVLKKATEDGAKYLANAIKLGNENKFEEAITAYKKVLETQPSNNSVKQNIGILFYKLGQFKNAIEWLDQTTSAAGVYEDGKSEYVIAACYVSLKETTKCCEYLNIAVAKNFTNALALQKQFCQ